MRRNMSRSSGGYMRRSRQRGKVSRKMMIIFAALILVIGGGLYFLNSSNNSYELLEEQVIDGVIARPFDSECELQDTDICTYLNNWSNVLNYSINTVEKYDTGEVEESTISVDGDNKSRIESVDDEGNMMDIISIDATTYIKDYTDETWARVEFNAAEMEGFVDNLKYIEFDKVDAENDKVTYEFLGKETVAGMNCFKYKVNNPDDPNATEYIWFDDTEYLLRQREYISTGEDGVNSLSYFTYGTADISEPSPVKDRSPEDFYFQTVDEQNVVEFEEEDSVESTEN